MTSTPLVFDAPCLSHFARAERLDVLRDLMVGTPCLTTEIVREEIRSGLPDHPLLRNVLDADWLGIVTLSSREALDGFVKWTRRIGSTQRDRGEASVFSAAELDGGIAITDDQRAKIVAAAHGLEVHGTLWLLAVACQKGKLTEVSAGNIVDALIATEMRLPCSGSAFGEFARRHGLL
ncbi:hypothetical protein [Herbidospora daliensis]|uniref:hypothetical protein n=1 Tax=Herbidospora daliensis TaxID=295585 RepID=UPI0007C6DDCE|nr:hypothetical protein [Herbidospora daliensis]